jgi:hypothetical protein
MRGAFFKCTGCPEKLIEQRIIAGQRPLRGEHRNRGGLSGAVGAEQAEDFSLADVEAQSGHSVRRTVALAEVVNP